VLTVVLDDGQYVPLHALTRNVGPVARLTASDFIDLVDKNNTHLSARSTAVRVTLIHVEQLVFFFLNQVLECVGDAHLAFLFLLAEHAGSMSLMLTSIFLTPWLEMISKEGMARSRTSRSTMR